MGTGENGALTFFDMITLISFVVGLQNLELNITQNDLQEQTQDINETADKLVKDAIEEIHRHLQEQDAKLAALLERGSNETDRKTV